MYENKSISFFAFLLTLSVAMFRRNEQVAEECRTLKKVEKHWSRGRALLAVKGAYEFSSKITHF